MMEQPGLPEKFLQVYYNENMSLQRMAAKLFLHKNTVQQRLNKILAENTGKTPEEVKADSERDRWMGAEEAREYGLVDKVIYKR